MRYGFIFLLAILSVLVSCSSDEKVEASINEPQQAKVEITAQKPASTQVNMDENTVPGRPQYDPQSPEIIPLPKHMAFDPCGLLQRDFALSLNIPLQQRIERVGGTRKIPEDHRYTPYVGCIWRNVAHGVPRVAIEVQQGAENIKANGEPLTGLGDAAWFAERKGREELRMHLKQYVIFIRAELPHDQLDSKQIHQAIAKHLLPALEAPPQASQIPLDASVFGGPKHNLCEAVKASGVADLLPGPEVWAIPTGAINHVPDEQSSKPDADYIGCTFAGTGRGEVNVRFLGPHGIKRQISLYNKQTAITINGIEGFRKRNGVYLPYGSGAFELAETMTPFDDGRLPQKLESIMQNIIVKVSQ